MQPVLLPPYHPACAPDKREFSAHPKAATWHGPLESPPQWLLPNRWDAPAAPAIDPAVHPRLLSHSGPAICRPSASLSQNVGTARPRCTAAPATPSLIANAVPPLHLSRPSDLLRSN